MKELFKKKRTALPQKSYVHTYLHLKNINYTKCNDNTRGVSSSYQIQLISI